MGVSPEQIAPAERPAGEVAPLEAQDDATLLGRFLAGEAGAFDVLHRRHWPSVCRALRRAGLDEPDAADVAQEAFVRAYRWAERFDPSRGSLPAWLGTIARNCMARHLARAARARTVDLGALEHALPAGGQTVEQALARREQARAVEDCLARLDRPLRRIVELRYVGALTTRAIAEQVGISEAGVRNRLAEAKERLAHCLGAKALL